MKIGKGDKDHLQRVAVRTERTGHLETPCYRSNRIWGSQITDFESLLSTCGDTEAEEHGSFKANVVFHKMFRLPTADNRGVLKER